MNKKCIVCGQRMEPIKNGFYFLEPDSSVWAGDLWGCLSCRRFQVHGIPKVPVIPLHASLKGVKATDLDNSTHDAILIPVLDFTKHFDSHMHEWYPYWHWKEEV